MTKRLSRLGMFIVVLLMIPLFAFNIANRFANDTPKAYAASLNTLSDTLSSMTESPTLANHTIMFITPTGITAFSETITLTFAAGFALGINNPNNYDLAVSAAGSCASFSDRLISGTAGGPDSWGVFISGQVITFYGPTSGTIGTSGVPAGRCVSIEIGANATSGASGVNQITNQTVAQNTTDPKITIAVLGTSTDTGSIATEIVSAANSQVGVSATVDPTIAFTMTPTTLLFGSLTSTSVRYADSTGGLTTIPAQAATPLLTASTNGVSGVLISIYDVTPSGLYSATVSDTIPAAAVNGLVAGNKKFGVTGLSGSSLTATPGFNGTGAGGTGVISTTAQSFASSAGPVGSGNIAMIMVASIDALTHAGAYSDTVTVVCTGRF